MQFLLVGIGGFFGAMSRYGIGRVLQGNSSGFPYATLAVNVSGSFIIGLLATFLAIRQAGGDDIRLVLMVGFLGSFTTFSAFSLETLTLVGVGDWSRASVNVVGNVTLCLLAVTVGSLLAKQWML